MDGEGEVIKRKQMIDNVHSDLTVREREDLS
jgi:hypothetical protein